MFAIELLSPEIRQPRLLERLEFLRLGSPAALITRKMTEVRVAAFEGLLRGSLKSGDHEGCDGLELVTKIDRSVGRWRLLSQEG